MCDTLGVDGSAVENQRGHCLSPTNCSQDKTADVQWGTNDTHTSGFTQVDSPRYIRADGTE